LVYDDVAAREAATLAGESRALLRKAGDEGLHDESIARTARDLFQLALAGAARLGPAAVRGDHLERAAAYYDCYTARSRAPADDAAGAERIPQSASRIPSVS